MHFKILYTQSAKSKGGKGSDTSIAPKIVHLVVPFANHSRQYTFFVHATQKMTLNTGNCYHKTTIFSTFLG